MMGLDGSILLWIQNMLRVPGLNEGVIWFTHLGDDGLLFLALSVLLLFFSKTRRAGLIALTAMFFGLLCTNLALKNLVARPRPWTEVAGLVPLVLEDSFSFPSGHTTAAFAFAGAMLLTPLCVKWGKPAALLLAVCMGLSRMYVGVHYPTDVLGGMIVGLLCAWAAAKLWKCKKPGGKKP